MRSCNLRSSGEGSIPSSSANRCARSLVCRECLSLAAGPVEREHQLLPRALPERITSGETLELADHLRVLADRELRLDPVLERAESQLFQPRRLRPQRRLHGKIGERRTAPEGEGAVERADGRLGVDREQAAGIAQQRLEPRSVQLGRLRPESVACPASFKPFCSQRLAQMRGVALECVPCRLGRLLAPDLVDQHIGRDQVVGS